MFQPGRIIQMGGASSAAHGHRHQWRAAGGDVHAVDVDAAAVGVRDGAARRPACSAPAAARSTTSSPASTTSPRSGTRPPAPGRVGASAVNARLYHGSALLLPDASVLVAGGGAPGPLKNLNAEIYYPPYLFDAAGARAARPTIISAPDTVLPGASFQVGVAGAGSISRVSFIKTGSVTHSFNMDQRFLQLPFTANGALLDRAAAVARRRCAAGLLHAVRAQRPGRAVGGAHGARRQSRPSICRSRRSPISRRWRAARAAGPSRWPATRMKCWSA